MEQANYTVYVHITPSCKYYVGITKNSPKRRWANGTNYKRNKHFSSAIKKYGWDNIHHFIVCEGRTREIAEHIEKVLIKSYESTNPMYGYNKTMGGESGKEYSLEAREKMSQSGRGKNIDEEWRKKLSESLKGRHFSEEHKKRIGIAGKGRKHTEEAKRKMSELAKGRKFSEETKKLIGEMGSKKVNQYTLDGKFIKTHKSSVSAALEFGAKWGSSITACCRHRQKTAYGYIWKYAEEQS